MASAINMSWIDNDWIHGAAIPTIMHYRVIVVRRTVSNIANTKAFTEGLITIARILAQAIDINVLVSVRSLMLVSEPKSVQELMLNCAPSDVGGVVRSLTHDPVVVPDIEVNKPPGSSSGRGTCWCAGATLYQGIPPATTKLHSNKGTRCSPAKAPPGVVLVLLERNAGDPREVIHFIVEALFYSVAFRSTAAPASVLRVNEVLYLSVGPKSAMATVEAEGSSFRLVTHGSLELLFVQELKSGDRHVYKLVCHDREVSWFIPVSF